MPPVSRSAAALSRTSSHATSVLPALDPIDSGNHTGGAVHSYAIRVCYAAGNEGRLGTYYMSPPHTQPGPPLSRNSHRRGPSGGFIHSHQACRRTNCRSSISDLRTRKVHSGSVGALDAVVLHHSVEVECLVVCEADVDVASTPCM